MTKELADFSLQSLIDISSQIKSLDIKEGESLRQLESNELLELSKYITNLTEDQQNKWKRYINDFEGMGYTLCVMFMNYIVDSVQPTYAFSSGQNKKAIQEAAKGLHHEVGGAKKRKPQKGGGTPKNFKIGFFFLRKKNQVKQDPNAVVDYIANASEADRLLNTLKPILLPKQEILEKMSPTSENKNKVKESFHELFRKLKAEEYRFSPKSFGLKDVADSKILIELTINGVEHKVLVRNHLNNDKRITFTITPDLPPENEVSSIEVTHVAIREYYTGKSKIIDDVLKRLPNVDFKTVQPPSLAKKTNANKEWGDSITIDDLRKAVQQLYNPLHHELVTEQLLIF